MLDRMQPMDPIAELIDVPAEYGSPKVALAWSVVRMRLEEAQRYWLATTRPDGRPHVVPLDGLWLDDTWYFGGSAETVHERNLRRDQRVVVHLEDALSAVIVEGRAEWTRPSAELAGRLAAASTDKYGYGPGPEAYLAGAWSVRPHRVLAWSGFPTDATRFRFTEATAGG